MDDIIIIFNQNKITEDSITKHVNNLNKYMEFNQTEEERDTIYYLDLHIHRNNNIQLGMYRKTTQSVTTIHFTSNHPLQHKFAAYNFYIHRLLSKPITEQAKKKEWNTICTIATNNGSPIQLIYNSRNKINKKKQSTNIPTQTRRKNG